MFLKKKMLVGLCALVVCACCVAGYFIFTSTSTIGEWERVSITLCPIRAAELPSGEVNLINNQLETRHLAEPMELHFEGNRNGGRGYNASDNVNFSWTLQEGNDTATVSIIEDNGRLIVMTHEISRFGNFPRMTLNFTVDGNDVREVWEFMRVRR